MSTSVVLKGKSGITKFGTFHHLRTTNVMAAHKTVAWVSCIAVLRALDDTVSTNWERIKPIRKTTSPQTCYLLSTFFNIHSACWLKWFTTLHWEKGEVALRLEMTWDTFRCAYIGPVAMFFFFSRTKRSDRCLSLVQVLSVFFPAISRLKAY